MSPANVLITGCNRGLGLEMVREYLKLNPVNLFATCRDPSSATELTNLAKSNSNLHVLKLEVTDHASFEGLKDQVSVQKCILNLSLLIKV